MSLKQIDLHFMGSKGRIAVYLLESEDGPILFDTGPYSCFPYLEKGLSEHGYTPSDVKHVVLTHIHLDHAGAAWHFAELGAKVYVHPLGEKHLIDPSKLIESATKIYRDQMDTLWGRFEAIDQAQLIVAEHLQEFRFENQVIKSFHTPGHAVHHIAWQTTEGIICGDVAGIRLGDGPVFPPCPPPDINLEDWKNSIDILLAESPQKIFMSHFGSAENGVKHLEGLKEEINIWDDYVSNLYAEFPDPKKAISVLSDWVDERIVAISGKPELLPIYSVFNSSWMNLKGLYNYYKKKNQS